MKKLKWLTSRFIRKGLMSSVILVQVIALFVLMGSDALLHMPVKSLQQTIVRLWGINNALHDVEVSLIDQETGQRGYVLTGDTVFLAPFTQGTVEFEEQSATIKALCRNFPAISPNVRTILTIGERWHQQYGLRAINEEKHRIPVSKNSLLHGKSLMDSLRKDIKEQTIWCNAQIVAVSHQLDLLSDVSVGIQIAIIVVTILVLLFLLAEHGKLRRELVDKEKLKLIGELAASMAHEIRNPLQVVRGFVQLIGENTQDGKHRQYVSLAISELDNSHHVLTEYLSLAKPVADNRQWGKLDDIINDVVYLLSALGNLEGCEIRVEKTSDRRLFVDVQKLKQVLMNIGKNAIEAMDNAGTLTFRAVERSREIAIVIRDTGAGMSEQQIARLGTPFYSTKENGTGLGLLIAYRMVDEIGGRINVRSVIGKGSTFEILLPATS